MQRILAIEGLRGVLALWVLCEHALSASGLGEHWTGVPAILTDGTHAVDVFIIVSGFVIFYLLDTAREGPIKFLLRRAVRLYPVYLVCLIASVPILLIAADVYDQVPWPHTVNVGRVHTARNGLTYLPQHLLTHVTMVHSLIPSWRLPSAPYAILGQAWSLSLEWQFYVVAPALFWALSRRGAIAAAAIIAACLAHAMLAGSQGFLPRHLPMFAAGIASYYLWKARPQIAWPGLPLAAAAVAYLLTHSPGLVIWTAVFFSACGTDARHQPLRRLLETRPLLALGALSYPIYLSHTLVITLSLLLLERTGAAALGQWPFYLVLLTLSISGTLVVSTYLHRFVEIPCIRLGKRLGTPAQGIETQAATPQF
jgi:peptidoglycan/LPS O-acetylase OafA/YrhL